MRYIHAPPRRCRRQEIAFSRRGWPAWKSANHPTGHADVRSEFFYTTLPEVRARRNVQAEREIQSSGEKIVSVVVRENAFISFQ